VVEARGDASDSLVKIEGNQYLKWIEDYSGESYQAAVKKGIGKRKAKF
jgi:hydroxymethylpyrimidine/phosphomethylpyrimidine kinase / thiaminase